MFRIAAFMVAAALVLAGCGSREVVLDPSGVPASEAASPTANPVDPGTPVPGEQASTVVPESVEELPSTPAPGPGRSAGPADHNTMPLVVTLNRTCATPGTLMQATAETVHESRLAFAASYADNSFTPNFTYVPAEGNPTGTFTWSWEITPQHPRGDALVTVVAAKDGDGDEDARGASYEAPFRVADHC